MSLVERFLSGTYTVTRNRGVKYIEGFPQDQGEETIKVRGSMQPMSAREMKFLEEGVRLKQAWNFYSDAPLLAVGTRRLARADTVKILDDTRGVTETYKVISTESWHGFGLEYYKSVLAREPEQ